MNKKELKEENENLYEKIEELETEIEQLSGGGFDGFLEICANFLKHYPPDIFVGGPNCDLGVEFVVTVRNSVKKIKDFDNQKRSKELIESFKKQL